MDRLLLHLKFGGALALADWAAGTLAQAVARAAPDSGARALPEVLVALPLTPGRQRERGFNQTQEIARGLSRRLGIPRADLLERTHQRMPQARLAWRQRMQNIRGAFRCRGDVAGRRIALVDDVMTTGATIGEAAQTLLREGAVSVEAWVVARTPPPNASSSAGIAAW